MEGIVTWDHLEEEVARSPVPSIVEDVNMFAAESSRQ